MASARTIAWIERLVWILIYAGLFSFVLGLATLKADEATAWTLIGAGAVLVPAGAVLIWVRARLHPDD
ncbi:MAG TPA: hypothetical protein VGE20_03095 [Ramlibacter sp.]